MEFYIKIMMLFVIFTAIPSKALCEIILCNEFEETINYSMVWDEGFPVIAPIWKTAGWYRLKPGACTTALRGNKRQELYLSVRKLTPSGPILAVFPLTESKYYTQGTHGIEELFCIKRGNKAFERSAGRRIEKLKECPEGWVSQTYNVLGFTQARIRLTMRLGEWQNKIHYTLTGKNF